MTWPPETDADKRAVLDRQRLAAPSLHFLATFERPMPPPEPGTEAEKAALRKERDAALAVIETFRGRV